MNKFNNISYIATEAVCTDSGFQGINAITGEALPGTFANNSSHDVERAAKAAKQAFVSYSRTRPEDRADFLDSIASEIELRLEAIVERANLETGLPEARLVGETGRTTGQLRMFSSMLREGSWVRAVIDTAQPKREPIPKPDLRLTVVPLGPVAVFGASNFPLAFSTAGGDTASALAAGCPVIVKAHGSHPGTGILVAEAINAAIKSCGIHPGVFSIISSDISRIGVDLVQHPTIKAVGFTGSIGGGRALFDLCKARPEPIPFYGELGSTNPVFLMPNALEVNIEKIAAEFIASMNMGCGQFCTNPGLLVAVKGPGLDKLKAKVSSLLANVEPQTMLSPSIAQSYEKQAKQRSSAIGVDVLAMGPEAGVNQAQPMVACVNAQTWIENHELEHEVFGPFNLLIECDSFVQMKSIIDRMYGHLTATIHAEPDDYTAASELVSGLRDKVGRILMNGWPTGVEVAQAMQHGGPYPAATFAPTSVGGRAIDRWVRPVSYQNIPDELLPLELQNSNPLNILRFVDGEYLR
ncbi:MAG: aldehyde dehydrogenase (NADP(+)) [Arenicella sp.]